MVFSWRENIELEMMIKTYNTSTIEGNPLIIEPRYIVSLML